MSYQPVNIQHYHKENLRIQIIFQKLTNRVALFADRGYNATNGVNNSICNQPNIGRICDEHDDPQK